MSGMRQVKKKLGQDQAAKVRKAAIVPTGFSFDGCQVLVCVPWGHERKPTEIAQAFSDQTKEMFKRAQSPALRDIYEATLAMQGRIMTGRFRINAEN